MKFDKNKLKESLRGVGESTLSIGRNAKRAADSLVKQAQAKWETRSPGLRKACVERTKASEEFAKSTRHCLSLSLKITLFKPVPKNYSCEC